MTKRYKITHILKGTDEDAFQMLILKSPSTVTHVIYLRQSYEELCRQRCMPRRPVPHQESLYGLVPSFQDPSLLSQIKAFVWEEVAHELSLISTLQQSTSCLSPTIRHDILEQVSKVLPQEQPPRVTIPLTYAKALDHDHQWLVRASAPVPTAIFAPVLPQFPIYRVVNPWRMADNEPICYS